MRMTRSPEGTRDGRYRMVLGAVQMEVKGIFVPKRDSGMGLILLMVQSEIHTLNVWADNFHSFLSSNNPLCLSLFVLLHDVKKMK